MIKTALILGGAKSVFEDYNRAVRMHTFDAVLAINDVGTEIPEVDFWCSMHPDKMPKWLDQRRAAGLPDPKSFWTAVDREQPKGLEFQTIKNTRGGSGLLAIYVARYIGYDRIVLAGVPMSREGEHYHTPGNWKECRLYRVVWEANASLREDVRSFSGWTKEQFGEPTLEWLSPDF